MKEDRGMVGVVVEYTEWKQKDQWDIGGKWVKRKQKNELGKYLW